MTIPRYDMCGCGGKKRSSVVRCANCRKTFRPEITQPDDPAIRHIPLTHGYFAIVDVADYLRCMMACRWQAKIDRRRDGTIKNVYAYRAPQPGGSTRYLHRFLLGIDDPHIQVDHEDGCGTNCRRNNLRVATQSQNNGNRRQVGKSGFKGVTSSCGKWMAQIRVNGKKVNLGRFADPRDAARAYDAAAVSHFGEFALTNEALHER